MAINTRELCTGHLWQIRMKVSYKNLMKMPSAYMTTALWWNSRCCALFGFPLNAILFWLIWTKTPKEMRVHSRILLQTCILDILLLCVYSIAIPFRIQHGSTIVTFLDGFFINYFWTIFTYDAKSLVKLFFFFDLIFQIDTFSISVQFLYRYLLLNRNIPINIPRYLLMLSLPVGTALFLSGFWYAFSIEELATFNNQALQEPFSEYIDWNNSVYYILSVNSLKPMIWFFFWITIYTVSFVFNLICGLKIVAFVRVNSSLNPNKKELNRQLKKNIIILALFPVILFISSFVNSALCFQLNSTFPTLVMNGQFAQGLMYCWLPVVNPLASIWINRPYRKAFLQLICFFKPNNAAHTSVTVVLPIRQ